MEPRPNDDPLVVTAILAGATDRFAELVDRYEARVRRVVGRDVRDAGLREEVVQTTFLQAFRGLGALATRERFEAWLTRIARNAVADALRQRSERTERELPLEELDPPAPGRDRPGWIWEEVGRLDAPDREVLSLRYRDGLSYREIAASLQVPLSTVRGRIYEARRALRRRLESQEDER
jgi:RNA polymerase sigma-70 factor (ECF subfamily)